ncbi:Type I restriction-modification system methyltransferase subunit [Hyella patelloides LEGE 07179]|uniref:site-specific DNA-methyltransferase (adenine-specific) n=1 Tax=Hyella patelloides LEGE 07179 TaxID=945734 RepID=A0A563VRY6_9CYAN|nr:TaqI-like C-terminal specificity domain-containing protein [Hyella patelloides]VEP14147.1 Type I restriction-modification system methyltransferase subunit [Hyella patelloides LEGE 07179]
MSSSSLEKKVHQSLLNLNREKSLKDLFWSQLNYDRVNQELSRRNWRDRIASELASDPLLLASGGANNDFRIIYSRFKSDRLLKQKEREVVNKLLPDNPYSLFVFSNEARTQWHFLNVKYDDSPQKRKLFRRIKVEAGDNQLRTATEKLSLLDLESFNSDSPLEIQKQHDEAFDVEVVTQKFFSEYRQVFQRVEKLIQGIDISEKKRLYTQKLFNRLMFIAFIQKKGWLTYNGNKDYLSALWKAYRKEQTKQSNFYRDRLSLLFFSGLNNSSGVNIIDINNGGFFKDVIGNVPFLNGGLFEQGQDEKDSNILVPDECIDSILHDLFQKFAFTVTESTPLDVEVAVDPEMLGKVFEELVTGRHESGSYYTPKPIVSFMCRESLKGYLKTQVAEESKEAIALLVDEQNSSELANSESILEALKKVRTCDLACGSGAYLLGMLHELLDLRQRLSDTEETDSNTVYQHKLEIIQNNLYGVDIDVFAVNIARLRLWLSLAVDYEGDKPQPLPNLKYKIDVGDSLISPNPTEIKLTDVLIEKYRQIKTEYIKTHNGDRKKVLDKEITKLKKEISLITYGNDKVDKFDWSLDFAEVFADGGFDIVVANPPYVRQELIKHLKPSLKKVFPEVYSGTADLYCFFYARAVELLKKGGMLAFISSNKWLRAKYGEKLRKYITDICEIDSITDFGSLPVFKSASTFPMIFTAKKSCSKSKSITFTQVKSLNMPYPDVLKIIQSEGYILPKNSVVSAQWLLTDATNAKRIEEMEAVGIALDKYVGGHIYYGVKTGFNKAFIIDGAKKEELIAQDPRSAEIIKPLSVGKDIRKWNIHLKDKWLIYSPWHLNIDSYPAVKKHFLQYELELKKRPECKNGRYKWWCMARYGAEYANFFNQPKIIFPDIASNSRFSLDTRGTYINNTVYFIPTTDLYLLGLLNSSIVWNYCKEKLAVLGDANKNGGLRFFRQYVEQIPIPNASNSEKIAISKLVQKCLDAKGVDCEVWEKEIDDRVAALYGL